MSRLNLKSTPAAKAAREGSKALASDQALSKLLTLKLDQVDQYVEQEVSDLAGAKTLLKVLTKATAILIQARRVRPA